MKKLLTILLATLMIFVFTGCGDSSTPSITERDDISLPSATITTEDSSVTPSSSEFTKGEIVDGVYINNWANLKFEISGNWVEGDQTSYDSYESTANTYCGLIAKDQSSDFTQLDIAFEKLTGINVAMTEDGYIDTITNLFKEQYDEAGYAIEISDTTTQTIANESYKSFKITFTELGFIQHLSVRKLDSYIVFINVTTKDSLTSNSVLNSIKTAY